MGPLNNASLRLRGVRTRNPRQGTSTLSQYCLYRVSSARFEFRSAWVYVTTTSACTQAAELLIMSFSYCPRQAIRQPSRLPQLYRNIKFSGDPACAEPHLAFCVLFLRFSGHVCLAIRLSNFCHCRIPVEWFSDLKPQQIETSHQSLCSILTCSSHAHGRGGSMSVNSIGADHLTAFA
jgi:hypothetical protein